MARLAVLQLDPTSEARVRDALSPSHDLSVYTRWPALRNALVTQGLDGCVIDPFALTPPVPASELRRLRQRHPHMLLVVFADFTGRAAQMTMFGGILDEIIVAGSEDEVETIRRAVSTGLSHALSRRLRSELESGIETEALVWAVENAEVNPDVSHLAAALNESVRSLSDRLRAEGGYNARSLLLWGRLFRAGQMLGSGRTTVQRVALALGYSADSAFRKTVRTHLGVPPSQVRARGGFNLILLRFSEARSENTVQGDALRLRDLPTRAP